MSFKKGHVIDFFKHGNFVIVNGFQVKTGWNWSFCTIQNKKKIFLKVTKFSFYRFCHDMSKIRELNQTVLQWLQRDCLL